MKKIIAVCLVVVMCLCFFACSNESNSDNDIPKDNNEVANDENIESETLELLNSAYSYCHTGMTYMLRAWEFSIEHSTDSTREEFESIWGEFSQHMYMTDDEIVDALIGAFGLTLEDLSMGNDPSKGINTVKGMYFMKAEMSVPVARYEFEQRNDGTDIDSMLEQIKENLKKIDDESEVYDLFKEYYLMVVEMEEWIDSPAGSYSTSSDSLLGYEKEANNFKQELDLIMD